MSRRPCLCLYSEPTASTLDVEQIGRYVSELLPQLEVGIRPGIVPFYLSRLSSDERAAALHQLAVKLAQVKVRNPAKQIDDFVPLPGEIDYEKRRLAQEAGRSFGIVYDGFKLMNIFRELLPEAERNLGYIHVVFTNQLFGTWEDSDRRYHARASVYGFPCLISTSGVVEAPAKPREYYLLKQQYNALGMGDATPVLDAELKGRFIDHGDPRLTEVMKGYVLQAIFYHLFGDPFCEDRNCRLYNAHWQQEVMAAQLASGRLCVHHSQQLKEFVFGVAQKNCV